MVEDNQNIQQKSQAVEDISPEELEYIATEMAKHNIQTEMDMQESIEAEVIFDEKIKKLSTGTLEQLQILISAELKRRSKINEEHYEEGFVYSLSYILDE